MFTIWSEKFKKISLCFVSPLNKLIVTSCDVPSHMIVLIYNLYVGKGETLGTEYGETGWFTDGESVREG